MAQPEDTPTEKDPDDPTDGDDLPDRQAEAEKALADRDGWAFGTSGESDAERQAREEKARELLEKGVTTDDISKDHALFDTLSAAEMEQAIERQNKSERDVLFELLDEIRGLRKDMAEGAAGPRRPAVRKSQAATKPAAPGAGLDDDTLAAVADVLDVSPAALAEAVEAAGGLADLSPADFPDDADPDPEAVAEVREAAADPEADSLLTALDVSHVSGVAEPAVDSRWLEVKSTDAEGAARWGVSVPLLLAKSADNGGEDGEAPLDAEPGQVTDDDGDDDGDDDADGEAKSDGPTDEERVTLAPVLRPGQTDKQGDRVAKPDIRAAAHRYVERHQGVDTDHSLVDEGQPVESYIIRNGPETFDLPSGGTETVEEGTWLVGIRWDESAWKRVKTGELQGLSIYGEADVVALPDAGADAPGFEGYNEGAMAMAAADAAEKAVKSVLGRGEGHTSPADADGPTGPAAARDDDREVQRKHQYEPGTDAPSSDGRGQVDSYSREELEEAGVLRERDRR